MTPWLLVLKHLRSAWLRVALTAGGVALAVFLMATLRTVITALDQTVNGARADRLIVSSAVSLFVFLPKRMETELRGVPGVHEVTHWTWFGGVYVDESNMFGRFATDPRTLRAVYGDRARKEEIVMPAEQWDEFEADRAGCVVGDGLVERFGFEIGKTVELTGNLFPGDYEFTVRGIYTPGSGQIDSQTMFFHWDYLDEQVGRRGLVSMYSLDLEPGADLAEISRAVDARYESSDHRTRTLTEAAFNQMFLSMWGNVPLLFGMIGGAVLFAAFMIALNTMLLHGHERRLEIGVLRALGFPNGTIVKLFLAEGLLVCGIGGLAGVTAANVIFNVLGVSFLESYFPMFRILPQTSVLALGTALGVGVLSGVFPAWGAVRRPIVRGLQDRG